MSIRHPNYPCVDASLQQFNKHQHKPVTDADREIADNFDVSKNIDEAIELREKHGINS